MHVQRNLRSVFIDYYRITLGKGECPQETVRTLGFTFLASNHNYQRSSTFCYH